MAIAGGARSLAVATGGYDIEALRAAGADVVLPNLSDLPPFSMRWGLRTGDNWRRGRGPGGGRGGWLASGTETAGSGRRRRDFSLRSSEHRRRAALSENPQE